MSISYLKKKKKRTCCCSQSRVMRRQVSQIMEHSIIANATYNLLSCALAIIEGH